MEFDEKKLYSFWKSEDISNSSEEELRRSKLGYRAKCIYKISKERDR